MDGLFAKPWSRAGRAAMLSPCLVVVCRWVQLQLTAARASCSAMSGATRRALAAIVRLGLTALLRGMNDASSTYRFCRSCVLQLRSRTLEAGLLPNLQVPQGCP